ncbi:hypothetical protein AB0953_08860 [Streptomyces sp. NPDC046866]|uniref:hypothetical protein n=1 Tax=Streptomyces sp. NPDC046866 TaxID=3154921 RepID=UPI0034556818
MPNEGGAADEAGGTPPDGVSPPEIPEPQDTGETAGHGGWSWLWPAMAVAAAAIPTVLTAVQQLFGVRTGRVSAVLVLAAALAASVLLARKTLQEKLPGASRGVRVLFSAVLVAVFAGASFVVVRFPENAAVPLHRFSGTHDVAVVGFTQGEQHAGQDQRVLDDVADTFTQSLKGRLPQGATAWNYAEASQRPPLAELSRPDHRGLDEWTRRFTDETNAGIVIGGIVTSDASGQAGLQPAFSVRPDQVVDAPELTGWYLGAPILLDQSWASPRGRAGVVAELVRRTRGLATFMDALDAWRYGAARQAAELLADLLPSGGTGTLPGDTGFVTPDLVRLFHGHALEQAAAGEPADTASAHLRAARADYEAIASDGPLGRRARLSLAGNTYLLALRSAPTCKAGEVDDAELKGVAATLRALADDPRFTEIGRLKASVNLAQVEQCRVTADPARDDGTVDAAVRRVREAGGDSSAVRELKALALSVGAQHAAGRGDLATAVTTIREAVSLEPRFIRRALWLGLAASWSYSRCDLATADRVAEESLAQLRAAVQQGEANAQRLEGYRTLFRQEATAARGRCPGPAPR